MINKETLNLEIPLGIEAHRFAGKFATEQATNEKSKQVYLNTLAVYGVHIYLKWLAIETDLSQSDCWNPILRNRWNVADLVIPEIGTLECRPVLMGETTVLLPPEVMEDRIGYLAVQFRNILDRVEILGFAKAPVAEVIQISRLLSCDDLIDAISPPQTDLEDWVRGIFDELWLPLEALLIPRKLEFEGFKTRTRDEKIQRAKEINLGLLVNRKQVALVVNLWAKTEEEKRVLIQVFPIGESKSLRLPAGLKLKVILESDEAEVIAREADNMIQLEFSEQPGKEFTVQVSFDNESVTEKFVV